MRGQPGASQVITSDATARSLPDVLCRVGATPDGGPTGCFIQVLTGSMVYLLHDPAGTPDTDSYTLNAGDLLELSAPHFFRHSSVAGATFRATRFESVLDTHVIRAAGTGGAGPGGGLTNTELRATPVPVSGTVTATGPLTDTQLRATPVPVSGSVTATTGGLTDTELRATPVPISGSVTTGGLTDTQLRATPVPVDAGSVTVGNFPATQAISAAALPLPDGAATDTTLSSLAADVDTLLARDLPTGASLETLMRELILELRDTKLELLNALH
jgi:hypothetical protein